MINWQERAHEFREGDPVVPLGWDVLDAGRVSKVYPAIGMVDVQFPSRNIQFPVEELQILEGVWVKPPQVSSHTGDESSSSSSSGVLEDVAVIPLSPKEKAASIRIAQAYLQRKQVERGQIVDCAHARAKQGLYWVAVDRNYRATRIERETKTYFCPRCKDQVLVKAVYKRENGQSEKLFGCKQCLFLVERNSIEGCHLNEGPCDE